VIKFLNEKLANAESGESSSTRMGEATEASGGTEADEMDEITAYDKT
jgi:hypothetical protein